MLLLPLLLLCAAAASAQRFNFEYAVVIESNAYDTLGSCLKFVRRNATSDAVDQIVVVDSKSVRTEPLANFADIGSLSSIKTNLQPIIDACLAVVPVESQPYSPVFLLLGGGVRALSKNRAEIVRLVAGQVLRLSGFRYTNESVVQPSVLDEAAYGFVGANYILGIGKGASRPTISIEALDFAVAQPTSDASGADAEAQFLDASTQPLSVTSFAQTIGDAALAAKLRALPSGTQPRQTWPCFASGYERVVRVVRRDYRSAEYAVDGSSNAAQCAGALQAALTTALAGRVLDAVGRGEFLPVGSFDSLLALVPPKEGVVDLDALAATANAICDKSWAAVQAAYPSLTTQQQADLCSSMMWSVTVLKSVQLSSQAGIAFEKRAVRGAVAIGYAVSRLHSWPIGAPARGIRCDELHVDIVDQSLPRVVMYQCDCVTFRNYDPVTVHYLTSSKLLNEVMPLFASAFLYPVGYKETGADFPNEYKVCSSTTTKIGKFNYTDVILEKQMHNDFVIRPQRNLDEAK